jgi:hypothetical protein
LIEHHFIYVAPTPFFARFKRSDDGMVAGMKMLCGMLVWRGIATAYMPTRHAQPQVKPFLAVT